MTRVQQGFIARTLKTQEYAYYSPYLYAGNSPILFIDAEGKNEAVKFENAYSISFIGGKGMSEEDKKTYMSAFNKYSGNGGAALGMGGAVTGSAIASSNTLRVIGTGFVNWILSNGQQLTNTVANFTDPNPMSVTNYGRDLFDDVLRFGTNIIKRRAEDLFVGINKYASYKKGTEVYEFVTKKQRSL